MLELDKPIVGMSSAEVEAERNRNFRWNFFVNSFDVTFFMGSINLLSATTILPLFISKLTSSTVPLALTAMVAQAGFFLPQLLTSNFVERLDRKKPVIVNIGFVTERLPAILLILAPIAAFWSPLLALILFLLLYSCFTFGGGVVATAWQELVARCFPVEWRGRFFGSNMFLGTALGVGAATLAGPILDTFMFPLNFVYIFGAAGVGITFSWLFLALTREPVTVSTVPRVSTRQYLTKLPAVLRADENFRNFLLARFVLALAEMGSGFLTVAAIANFAIADSMVATFTTATLIGQMLASVLLGFFSDRYGHQLSLEISTVAVIAAFGMAWLASSGNWYIAVFFLLGFFTGARIVSGTMVVMEFSTPEKRPTYIGLANTLIGIGSAVAPLLGALLVKVSFSLAFAASMVTSIIALLMLRFWVKDPRFIASSMATTEPRQ